MAVEIGELYQTQTDLEILSLFGFVFFLPFSLNCFCSFYGISNSYTGLTKRDAGN